LNWKNLLTFGLVAFLFNWDLRV